MTRIANVSGREFCHACVDEALVLIGTRHEGAGEVEMFGPCPECEMGFRCEFPAKAHDAPWGRDGFWRGAQPVFAVADRGHAELSRIENGMRLRLLSVRLAKKPADVLVGLEPLLGERERLELLSAELRRWASSASSV